MDDQSRNLILATALSFLVILGWFLLVPVLPPTPVPTAGREPDRPGRADAGDAGGAGAATAGADARRRRRRSRATRRWPQTAAASRSAPPRLRARSR